MVTENIWASIVAMCQTLVDDMENVQFIDWESHADLHELPNADLLGPTSLAIEEDSPGFFSVSFAVAVSVYDDLSLFRHRRMIAKVFNRLRVEQQIAVYDLETAEMIGWMKIVDGTTMAPMTRAQTRPWQFVQCAALLQPQTTAST